MRHTLKISVAKEAQNDGIIGCRHVTVREKLLRMLLGDKCRLTVIVPGNSVKTVAIQEVPEEGD